MKSAEALFIFLLFVLTANNASASVISQAFAEVNPDSNTLIITNLGYAEGSEALLDEFFEEVLAYNLSVENNVQFVHAAYNKPLWIAFFNKSNGNCVYFRIENGSVSKKVEEVISAERIFSNPKDFDQGIKMKFDGNEFSIISIANVWAKGMTWELRKAAEFHNHICPGLVSGLFIAEYLKKFHPPAKGESYLVLAVPPWCKDDYLQIVFDSTVGKKGMFAMQINTSELPSNLKNLAGVYVLWNSSSNKGKLFVLTFDFDKVRNEANVSGSQWYEKLKMALVMMDHLAQPETYVAEVSQTEVNSTTLQRLQTAGINPLVELGLIKNSSVENTVTRSTPFLSPFAVAVCMLLAYAVFRIRR